MIALRLPAIITGANDDFVCRVSDGVIPSDGGAVWAPDGALLARASVRITLPAKVRFGMIGDVLLVRPRDKLVQRLIRADSRSNFFLVTEQCDQLCIMCSQPPKKSHHDQFQHFGEAATLAPAGSRITITGGEPTLHKGALFKLISDTYAHRPDIRFHILSNGQHLDISDRDFLLSDAGRVTSWGVPLYAAEAPLHDQIVGKPGAYQLLLDRLALLCRTGSSVELRTVVMSSNALALPALAKFITTNVPFASPWALMQLENTGFARNRWRELFFDSSVSFEPLKQALEIARMAGIPARLYNFPLCTIPAPYRRFALSTISDWKKKYLSDCSACPVRAHCGGFFEWYREDAGFGRIGFT